MLLAKSCHKKDNITHGTLKLGTLHEYRTTEIKQIADEEEGVLKLALKFDGAVTVTEEWLNVLMSGMVQLGRVKAPRFLGRYEGKFDYMDIETDGYGSVVIRNSYGSIKREVLNGFVYCMSLVREKHDTTLMFPDYDDSWHIDFSHANTVAKIIASSLLEQIKNKKSTGTPIIPDEVNLENIEIIIRHARVTYLPREISITNDGTYTLEKLLTKIEDTAFLKPPKFSPEQEYRFNFYIKSNNRVIQPLVKYLILDSHALQKLMIAP